MYYYASSTFGDFCLQTVSIQYANCFHIVDNCMTNLILETCFSAVPRPHIQPIPRCWRENKIGFRLCCELRMWLSKQWWTRLVLQEDYYYGHNLLSDLKLENCVGFRNFTRMTSRKFPSKFFNSLTVFCCYQKLTDTKYGFTYSFTVPKTYAKWHVTTVFTTHDNN